ncbi:MAG: SDR family oxidoreductase [Candidatus Helarchaeota archaeon]|nr:SDR family oxidoreductase [Candidatus Helarchaeota archaeon]
MKLKGKVALITGGTTGIGKATAILFAKEGAKIAINGRTEKKGQDTLKALKNMGAEAIFIQGDVSKATDAKKMVEETIKKFKKLDILFNNAGTVTPGTIESLTEEEWDREMAINVKGVFLVTKSALPELRKTKGCIINNASVIAVKGVKNRAVYSASKGAVLTLTKAMAAEFLDDGIRVNAILPGVTDTPSLHVRLSKSPDPEATKEELIARQPLKRMAKPEEIAGAVLFLAVSEFSTGTALFIDGGMTI